MAYSTPAMIRLALVPTSDGSQPDSAHLTHTAADLSDAQLGDSIAEADAMIDGYIGGFYSTPVANDSSGNVPHPLDYWSRNIAAYNATLAFRGSQDFPDTDPVARRYKETMDALKAVSAGRMKLPLTSNSGGNSQTQVGRVQNPYEGTLWTPADFDLREEPDQPGPAPYWRSAW